MRSFGKTLSVLFGLALICALGAGAYFAIRFVVKFFGAMEFVVPSATAVVSVVVLLAAMIVASSIRAASRRNEASQLRAQRGAAYQHCISLWASLVRDRPDSEEQRRNKLSDELEALDSLLVLYASPRVIKAHAALRASEREGGARNPNMRSLFAKALMEMRKDLCTETWGVTAEELQRLLLARPDEVNASAEADAYQDLRPRVSLASNSR
jgi:hypothetical protein